MKKTVTLILIFFCLSDSFSQGISPNWFNMYNRTTGRGAVTIAEKNSGDLLAYHAGTFLVLNANGDSLYTFSHTPLFANKLVNIDGSIFILGDEAGFPNIARLDGNDSLQWNKRVLGNSGELHDAVLSSNSEIICVGEAGFSDVLIAKTDLNGDTIWAKTYDQSSFTGLTDVIELLDGDFLASGYVDDYGFLMRFDTNGDTVWTYQTPYFISLTHTAVFQRPTEDIVFIARNHVVNLDQAGNVLSSQSFNNKDFYTLAAQNDNLYLMGQIRVNNDKFPYVEVLDANLDSAASYLQVGNIYAPNNNVFYDHVTTNNGGIIAAGEVEDSVSNGNNDNLIGLLLYNASPTGLKELGFLKTNELTVFPNPASEALTLSFGNTFSGTVELLDITGKLVMAQRILEQEKITLSLPQLPVGNYHLRAVGETTLYTQQVAITR